MIPVRLLLALLLMVLTPDAAAQPSVLVGADHLFEQPYRLWIEGKRVGLITNSSGVNSRLQPTWELLANHAGVELVALFGPEHGFLAHQSGESPRAGSARFYSLYDETRKPTPEMLAEVEVLLFDLQDVGVRFYTYISTLFLGMQAAAEQGIPFVVLDRPNPIGGARVEGPLLEPAHQSFVGIFPLPVRYGMTVGELARMFNHEAELGCDLRVVPMSGWKREFWYDQTGLEWIAPSPNMATLKTATVYPGSCLLEGTNLSEGRGTVTPFELFGAPWLDARTLADRLNKLNLPGVHFRVQAFVPTSSKYRLKTCQGIQIHVTDRDEFNPLPVVLHLLRETARLHPGELEWQQSLFDRLAGTSQLRQALSRGDDIEMIVGQWEGGLREFRKKRQRYLIYP